MLPNLSKLSLRCAPCDTLHTRPPELTICNICQDPLWGVEDDDEDDEGGDATKRVGQVNMAPDLKLEVQRRLGVRAYNRLVEPNRLLAPPDKWRMRHEQGNPAQPVPVISLSCGHWFHANCIANWANQKPNRPQCPTCMSEEQPGQRIIDQDLRDMGMDDLIPPPAAPAPAPVVPPPPTVAEARGILNEARERERAEVQRQRNIRDEQQAEQRRQRERALREANRLKSIARLRLVLARRAIKDYQQKVTDVKRYVGWEKRKVALQKEVATRKLALDKARWEKVAEEEGKLQEILRLLQVVEDNLRRHTMPVGLYMDTALRNRGKAYLALTKAMADGVPPDEADRKVDEVRKWMQLLLDQDQMFGVTASLHDRGTFFNQVVNTQVHPPQIVSQPDFKLALERQFASVYPKTRWMGGGEYARAEDVVSEGGGYWLASRGETHTYLTGFGDLSRGLWMIDPLVPMPGMETASGGYQVQWPPQPQGDVPIPGGVSLWFWSRERSKWEPEGLVAAPASAAPTAPGSRPTRHPQDVDAFVEM